VGLSWQQGPLSTGAIGRFLVPEPLPKRLLYVELLRRRMRVRFGGTWIADSEQVLLLFEPGRYPVAYFPETDISSHVLTPVKLQTFCPYKGLCNYYTIADARLAAWSYPDAYTEVRRISNLVSFEPDIVTVHLDDAQLHLEPGQEVTPHGPDRNLTVDEAARPAHLRERAPAAP
jgi:uncharacterized protein (DUF427 family)